MNGRAGTAARGIIVVATMLLAGGASPGCYDVPQPDCGFVCGPEGACPADYTCNTTDRRCHRVGSSPTLVCTTGVDAAVDAPPVDAPPIDAPPIDAPLIDAPPIDAPPIDAPLIDAP